MFIAINQEQLKQMSNRPQTVKYIRPLPKHLKWTLPLMDDVVKEVREKLAGEKPQPRINTKKIMDEVIKEMKAGGK